MTKAEDKHRGNLTVTLDYIKVAQDIKSAIYFLQNLRDKLDVAAIEKGIAERERRINGGCRRRKEDVQS